MKWAKNERKWNEEFSETRKKNGSGKLQAERKDEFADLLNMMSAKLRKG